MKRNFNGRHFGVLPEISSGSSGKILYFFVFYQLTKLVYCIKKCRIFLCRRSTISLPLFPSLDRNCSWGISRRHQLIEYYLRRGVSLSTPLAFRWLYAFHW